MSFNEAVRSQQENKPPERGERKRRYMLESPDMERKLKKEREAWLKERGFCETHIIDGGKIIIPTKDCVRYPNGTYYPKVEFLMDKLGPKTFTKMLRDKGFHWARSESLEQYRSWRDSLVLELVTHGKQETLL